MNRLNEMIAHEKINWKRLSGQKGAQTWERAAPIDEDIRRQTILGGIDTECFPWLLRLQPQETEAENLVEFAPWASLLTLLAGDKDNVNRVMEEVSKAFPEMKFL